MIYARVVGAVVVAALLKAAAPPLLLQNALHVEVHGIASYLDVLGALYSIVMAFVIYVVWDQFNRVQSGLAHEASALEDLCRVATQLSERDPANRIRGSAKQYMKTAASDEPERLGEGKTSAVAQDQFAALCQAVRGAELKADRDSLIYPELLRALARVSEARDARLAVSATRIPGTLWNLVRFMSVVLFAGFLVLDVGSFLLSLALVAAVAASMAFLLSVVKDMDNPFVGVWNVSYAPLTAAAARIK